MDMDVKYKRHEIENTAFSSGNDPDLAFANTTWVRRVGKNILETGWVAAEDLAWEIPFDKKQWYERVKVEAENMGLKVSPDTVLKELMDMGILIRSKESDGVFRWRSVLRWQSACEQFTASTNLTLEPYRDFVEGETGENTATLADKTRRIGVRTAKF
jgi:hypothetical protein